MLKKVETLLRFQYNSINSLCTHEWFPQLHETPQEHYKSGQRWNLGPSRSRTAFYYYVITIFQHT